MLQNTKFFFCIVILTLPRILVAAPECENWIANMVSTKGRVEKQRHNYSSWRQVEKNEYFCQDDRIRTRKHSRMKLVFTREPATDVELEQNSTLTFPKSEENPSVPFNLFREGALLITKVFINIQNLTL